MESALDVHIQIQFGFEDGRTHPRPAGQMNDDIEFPVVEQLMDQLAVAKVAFHHGDRPAELRDIPALDRRIVIVVKLVQHGNPPSLIG